MLAIIETLIGTGDSRALNVLPFCARAGTPGHNSTAPNQGILTASSR